MIQSDFDKLTTNSNIYEERTLRLGGFTKYHYEFRSFEQAMKLISAQMLRKQLKTFCPLFKSVFYED